MKNTTARTPNAPKRGWLKQTGILCGALIATLMGNVPQANANTDQEYRELFHAQGYEWCDARKLAKIYEVPPGQAKIYAGQKIAAGNLHLVQAAWTEGVAFFKKYGFTCGSTSLKDTSMERYAYNDAERVSDAWKSSTKS